MAFIIACHNSLSRKKLIVLQVAGKLNIGMFTVVRFNCVEHILEFRRTL